MNQVTPGMAGKPSACLKAEVWPYPEGAGCNPWCYHLRLQFAVVRVVTKAAGFPRVLEMYLAVS